MTAPTNILLVEKNNYHAVLVEREISRECPGSWVCTVKTRRAVSDALNRSRFDAAIVGNHHHQPRTLDVVELIHEKQPTLPIVILVSDGSCPSIAGVTDTDLVSYLTVDDSFPATVSGLIQGMLAHRQQNMVGRTYPPLIHEDRSKEIMNITVGTLSHEINNPLMTILGMSELILNSRRKFDSETAQKVEIIQKSAQRIQASLKRLASISEPTLSETPSGTMIDSYRSLVLPKSRT